MVCGDPDQLCSDLSADSWRAVDTDHRNSVHAVPDKGKEVWHGHINGNLKRPSDGAYRNGILGCTAGSCVWPAGRPDPVLRYSFYRNTLFSRRQIV